MVGKFGDRARYLLTGIDLDDLLIGAECQDSALLTKSFKQIACHRLSAQVKLELTGIEGWSDEQGRILVVQAGKQQMKNAHVVKWMNSLRVQFKISPL